MIARWTRVRIAICALVLSALAVKVGRRAFELQVEQAEELRGKAEDQYLQQIELKPQRGRILDRNESELASTAQFDSVSCNPRQLLAVPDGVRRLAKALDMDHRALRKALEGKRYFAWVKHTIPWEESAAVKALALPGVELRKEPKRIYPAGELGATVVGHATTDGVGVEGAEKAWDRYLRGTRAQVQGVRDGRGRSLLFDGLGDTTNTAGKDLVLSLDKYLMYVTEKALAEAVKKWDAKGATSIMMDPHTGEILAMASVPTYDPHKPGEALERGARNRAITDMYEPGSTMKAFTLAATLDAGKVRPSDWFDCQEGRPLFIGKKGIKDDHPEGVLSAAEVFQRSSNIGTVKIARRLGKQGLYDALLRFGFGQRTGTGLLGERRGILHPVQKWGELNFATVAFGQGLTVTPLQMVTGYSIIANGGLYKPPRLALRVRHPDGRLEPLPPEPGARAEERVLSEKTSRAMLTIMRGVTQSQSAEQRFDGTATRAAIDGYPVAGKTGTAQKVVNGHYGAWISSFIGIVPADSPRLVIAVIIDQPEPEHRGGMVAAPVFKEIAEAALRYLAVPRTPGYVANAKKKPDADKAGKPGAAQDVGEGPGSDQPVWADTTPEDLDVVAEGADEEAGATGEGDAEGESAADVVRVPSFLGMSMGEAIRAARQAGIEITPDGSGVAVAQNPLPGSVPRGAVCRVSFRPRG